MTNPIEFCIIRLCSQMLFRFYSENRVKYYHSLEKCHYLHAQLSSNTTSGSQFFFCPSTLTQNDQNIETLFAH